MDALAQATASRDVMVIEDAAEAIGSEYRGKRCGALGKMACFSFFANKLITTGEGGMVVTSDPELSARLRYFKNLCFPRVGPRRYLHEDVGFNYRMPNLLAAFGLGQLECADKYLAARRRNARAYNARLQGQRGITTPPEADYTLSSYWMYSILIEDDFGLTRDEVMQGLAAAKIETRRPAPAVPAAGNAARPERRIPAARDKSAAAAPIKLPAPPRSGVVRPRTHLAETPAPPTRRK